MPESWKLRLDPWAAPFEGAFRLAEESEPAADVDPSVELEAWAPLRPAETAPLARICFVDGVRRIEHRLLVEHGDRTLFGLLGSFAVGATEVAGSARIVAARVGRVACVGGGLRIEAFRALLPDGRQAVTFDAEAVADNTPEAALEALQNTMRRGEAALAAELSDTADAVFLDGPLSFFTGAAGPVVGVVKSLLQHYVAPEQESLLRRLATGQRTPLFLVRDPRLRRYSWYARIAVGRAIDSPLTGILRLETPAGCGLAGARALADAATRELPRFASDPRRDPRAPQNLYPIGALEAQLRHRLGHAQVIRRAIEASLQQREAIA